jgi:hypothetical protein
LAASDSVRAKGWPGKAKLILGQHSAKTGIYSMSSKAGQTYESGQIAPSTVQLRRANCNRKESERKRSGTPQTAEFEGNVGTTFARDDALI